jgi:hypothetical protein
MLATRDAGKYFLRKIFFMPLQVPMEPGRIEIYHVFAAPFKEKWKAFNLTCFSSTPFGFMPMQTIWYSLR